MIETVKRFLESQNRPVSAFAGTAGIGMKNEFLFPYRFHIIYQQVMCDTVAEISRPNFADFGVGNSKTDVLSASVCPVFQISFHPKQVFFEMNFELGRAPAFPLGFPALVVSFNQVEKRKNFMIFVLTF